MRASELKKAAVSLMLAVWLCAGCGLPESRFADLFKPPHKVEPHELQKYQKRYQTTRDKRAMRWLLAHAVKPGMTRSGVEEVLGQEGIRELNDRWLKTKGNAYRVDDVIYCFGPDDEGNSVYLGFRDDSLINFEPEEFSEGGVSAPRKRHKKHDDEDDA